MPAPHKKKPWVGTTLAWCLATTLLGGPASAATLVAEPAQYMRPPEAIAHALEMPSRPSIFLNPTRDCMALLAQAGMPTIAELAEPELKLAGERINPRNNGPSRSAAARAITFKPVSGGPARAVTLPAGARVIAPLWSPDGRHLAFLLVRDDRVQLWQATAASGTARQLAGHVNATFGRPFEWLPDSSGLIVRLVPPGRGEPPVAARVPAGPVIQETGGRAKPVQTLRNPLRTPYDGALFAYYFTSQLAVVPLDGGPSRPIGAPGVIAHMSVSPDGRYILETRLTGISHSTPASAFPARIVVSDRAGKLVHEVATQLPNDGQRTGDAAIIAGPRSVEWRADADATLVWAEADDAASAARDRIYMVAAPFAAKPTLLLDLAGRYVKTLWGSDDLALIEALSAAHRSLRIAIDPSDPGNGHPLVDAHADRGFPVMRMDTRGQPVLQFAPGGEGVLVAGVSHDHPFLSRMDLRSGGTTRLWTGDSPEHVRLQAVLDGSARHLLLWRQNRTTPPNLFVLDRRTGSMAKLTDFTDPAPQFAGIQHRFVPYDRADGIHLGGTLYLPAGYDAKRDGPLPMLMWAYPTDYASAAAAGRADGDSNIFIRPRGIDPPLLLLTQGYAIFEPRMPIVGSHGKAPNATYVAQLVANARAAVDAVVRLGVADRDRIAIGGHSYGAAMVVNLLAWSDLFRTGIAMSGAYNRTLTPFGFQTEHRTLWEAPEDYLAMSPFVHADRINEPLLLIHGGDDPKTGTVPMQSERLFAAIRELGGTARYVLLPYEGHSYQARESVMHTFWEMTRWLDRHMGSGATAPSVSP
jgi:dipeptidyl aminopeptidase/acylaminoacyl peptidase